MSSPSPPRSGAMFPPPPQKANSGIITLNNQLNGTQVVITCDYHPHATTDSFILRVLDSKLVYAVLDCPRFCHRMPSRGHTSTWRLLTVANKNHEIYTAGCINLRKSVLRINIKGSEQPLNAGPFPKSGKCAAQAIHLYCYWCHMLRSLFAWAEADQALSDEAGAREISSRACTE